jgi:hypothetical protein
MQMDREIIYFDEATTNLWQQKAKIWLNPKDPSKILLSKSRGVGITVLGAISNKYDKVIYLIDNETSKDSVLRFI